MAEQWSGTMALAWTHLWQVTLLIGAVAILVRLLGRNWPHLVYALWLVVLVKCVTPPLFTSASGVFCWLQPVEQAAIDTAATTLDATSMADVTYEPDGLIIPLYPVESLPLEPAEPVAIVRPTPTRFSITHIAVIGVLVWLLGAAVSLGLSVWQWLACLRTARRSRREADAELVRFVQDLAGRLGLRRTVSVIVTQGRLGPAVTGVFRAKLLMPEGMLVDKTPAELEPILAHELLHVRRGDVWAGLLQTIVLALWWFHPLVRWAVRETMREAERCCDEAVLAELGCKPKEYARSLLDVLQYKTEWAPAPAFPGAGRVDATANRLERIMRLGQGCRRRSPWWCWLVMIGVAAVVLPGGAFVVSGEQMTAASDAYGPAGNDSQLTIETTWIRADSASMESIVASEMPPEVQTQIKKAGQATLTEIQNYLLTKQIGKLSDARVVQSPKVACFSGQQVFVSSDGAALSILPRVQADNTIRVELNFKKKGRQAEENGVSTRSAEIVALDGSTILLAAPGEEKDTEEKDRWVMVCLRQAVTAPAKIDAASIVFEPAATPGNEEADRYWETYKAADLLDKIEQTAGSRDEAKTELMKLCGIEDDRQGLHAPESRIVWKDDTMIAVATGAEHETIRAELEAIREHGLCSLEIEVLCVQGPASEIEAMVESEGTGAELLKEKEEREASVVQLTCKSFVARCDLKQVMRQSQANPAVRVLASPRLRVRTGQTATVRIGEEIRVGPATAKESAAHRYVPVGLEMQFQPRLRVGNKVLLHSDVTFSEAVEVIGELRSESKGTPLTGTLGVVAAQASSTTVGTLGKTIAIQTAGPFDKKDDSEQALLLVRVNKPEAGPLPAKKRAGSLRAWLPLGLELETIDKEAFKRDFSTHYRGGLRVTEVRPGSPAAKEAVKAGDVLVGLHIWETTSLRDVDYILDRHEIADFSPVKFYLLRDGKVSYGHFEFAGEGSRDQLQPVKDLYVVTYNVADLVVPIPDTVCISLGAKQPQVASPSGTPVFDELIALITATVSPETWEDVGGPGSIAPFETNLSLVIRQSEAVHDEIVDCLSELRRRRDNQIVVRSRWVTVSDEFCEATWPEMAEKPKPVVMSPGKTKELLEAVGDAGIKDDERATAGRLILEGPKVTLFSGQLLRALVPTLSNLLHQEYATRLSFVATEDKEAIWVTGISWSGSQAPTDVYHQVKSGDTLVVEVPGAAVEGEPSMRGFLFLTPMIVEEEKRVL